MMFWLLYNVVGHSRIDSILQVTSNRTDFSFPWFIFSSFSGRISQDFILTILKVLIHAAVNVLASLFAVIFTVDLRKFQQ